MAAAANMWMAAVTFLAFISKTTSIHFEDLPSVEVMHQQEMEAQADARCVLCKFVMEEIDNWLTGPVVKNYIKAEFMPTCEKHVPFEAEKVCHALVDIIDDALSELVYEQMAPNAACDRFKMCPKVGMEDVRESTSVKMPHSSDNFLCGLCKEMIQSAVKLSASVLDGVSKEVIEFCEESPLNKNGKLAHDLLHDIQERVKAGPLSHQNMCINSLKAC